MNEHAARIYFELCRETVLDQNRISKQYSTLASGIITLASLLFVIQVGVGVELAGGGGWLLVLWGPLFLSLFLLVFIAVSAWKFVFRPYWYAEYNVGHAEDEARNTASGQKAAQTLVEFAEYYRDMIDFNRKELLGQRAYLGTIFWVFGALVVSVLSTLSTLFHGLFLM